MSACLLIGAALVAAVHVSAGSARAGCAPGVASSLASTGSASQLVTVVAPVASSTSGTMRLWQRSGGCWRSAGGPVERLPRVRRRLGQPPRGRRDDARRRVRARAGDVRRRARSRGSLRLPPARVRRLVGRGSGLAGLQHVPACRVRDATAFRRGERGALALDAGVLAPRLRRVQHLARRCRGAARRSSSTSRSATRRTAASRSPPARMLQLVRWLRPAASPLVVIGTAAGIAGY